MFQIEESFEQLPVRREQVLALLRSINAVSVKVPSLPAGSAMGYIVAWRTSEMQASVVIYLHYAEARDAAAYLPETPSFALTELPARLDEALEFVESMGFMMDDMAYGTLRPEEQVALIERTPLFHKDLARFAPDQDESELPGAELVEIAEDEEPDVQSLEQPSERACALGRLLMSF